MNNPLIDDFIDNELGNNSYHIEDDGFCLSTETGCPNCKNDGKDVYLVQCRKSLWKVCDKCKSVYYCEDASGGTFTDGDFMRWCDENKNNGKTTEDYEKGKMAWLEEKFKDYTHRGNHPKV